MQPLRPKDSTEPHPVARRDTPDFFIKRDTFWKWFPWVVLVLFLLPQWLCGQDTTIVVQDMLDSDIAHRTLLAKSGMLWTRDADAIVPSILGGVPRGCLASGIKPDVMLYAWLPPYYAWNVHDTVVRFIALAGALRLAKTWMGTAAVQPRDDSWRQAAIMAAAISFALAPWQTVAGLAVGGQPWLVWSWLRLHEARRSWFVWAIWPMFAVWSTFSLGGPTLVVAFAIWWLLRAWKNKTMVWAPLAAMGLYLATAIVVDWPLFSLTLKGFDHHRYTWDAVALAKPLSGALGMGWHFLSSGHDTAPIDTQLGWLLLVCALAAMWRGGHAAQARLRSVLPAIASLLVIALFHTLWQWRVLAAFRQPIPIMRFIQLDRFYLFGGLAWLYITLQLGASFSHRAIKWLLIISPLWVFICGPIWKGVKQTLAFQAGFVHGPPITFRRFVAEDLFRTMQQSVHPKRVASLGMHPAVAQLNGLSTVDGYLQIYPRIYKEKFRRVIAGRLARDPKAATYFDAWGSRVYLGRDNALPPHNIEGLDTNALCDLGTDYVLSNGPVISEQAAQSGWELRFHQTSPNAAWDLHAYRLPCSP